MADEDLFRDLDTARPLPADVRRRLEETLLAAAPRALPDELSRRLASRLTRSPKRPPWWMGAAAAAAVALGASVAVLAGSGGSAGPRHTAARSLPTPVGAAVGQPAANLARPSAAAVAPAGAPVVDSLAPRTGSVRGGTWVTITGSRLETVTAVFFGNTPAERLAVVSASQVKALSPPHPPGAVEVEVNGPSGRSTAGPGSLFTYTS